MEVRPILSALLRNRAGATLVAIQIAITLAIVVNAVFVTEQRLTKIGRPSGIDDQNIFSFNAEGFEKGFDFPAMQRDDLALMRQMPGVVDAAPMKQIPLSGSGNSSNFFALPDKKGKESPANIYESDEHGISTLGTTLSAGSTFDPSTIVHLKEQPTGPPPTAIVSQAFAKELFPDDKNSLGRTFYDSLSKPIKIVGIIEHMHGAWVSWDKFDHIVLFPQVGPGNGTRYMVRTAPGEIDRVMSQVEVALRKRDPNRVIANFNKMSDFKKRSYAGDSLVSVTLSVVTGLVLVFSALGIFGLATFNVNTRTRQIGTRRAVGARRRDIVRYFMTENWFVTTLGVVTGCAMALGLGFWLSKHMGLPRLDLYYLVGGVAGIWVIGQLAAWQPSLKAAKVSPAMATRTV
jgi:putative ABC transport system permease protein